MAILISVAAALVIGIMLAAQLGPAMLDPMFFIPFTCLAAFFGGNSSTEPLWRAIARPLVLMAGILIVAMTLINLDPPHNRLPDAQTAIAAAALAASATFLAAAVYRWMVKRFSVNAAKWTLRGAMLALYCLYRWMPGEWFVWINEQSASYGILWPCLLAALTFAGAGWVLTRETSG